MEQSVSEGLCPVEILEQFMEDCVSWKGPHDGAEKECEEEGDREMKCYEPN